MIQDIIQITTDNTSIKKTVQIDYDVWKKLKLEAVDTDSTMAKVIEKIVEYYGL